MHYPANLCSKEERNVLRNNANNSVNPVQFKILNGDREPLAVVTMRPPGRGFNVEPAPGRTLTGEIRTTAEFFAVLQRSFARKRTKASAV